VDGNVDTTGSLGVGTAGFDAKTRLMVQGADDTDAKALFVAGNDNTPFGDTFMKVGINTLTPAYDLSVIGIAQATGGLLVGSVPIAATLHVEVDNAPAHMLVKTTTSGQASMTFDRARVDDVAGFGLDTAGASEWRVGMEAATSDFTISEDVAGTPVPRLTVEKATDTVVIPSLRVTDGNQASGKVLTSDAGGNASWQNAGATGWLRTGNNAPFVDNADNLLGTNAGSNAPLNIIANGERALRIEPSNVAPAFSPNIVAGARTNAAVASVGATIAGGGAVSDGVTPRPNTVAGDYGSVGGGWGNTANQFAVVGGGQGNAASAQSATVGGGELNLAAASFSTIGGGSRNRANAVYSTVSGGGPSGDPATTYNVVHDDHGTIGGGGGNRVGDDGTPVDEERFSTVSGGEQNVASGLWAVVGGGYMNVATGEAPAVGGGQGNEAGSGGTVGGGVGNVATGYGSTVPGGMLNTASGDLSFAAGWMAHTNGNQGAFVWADSFGGAGEAFTATGPDQFLVRAGGGMGVGTDSPGAQLHVVGDDSVGNAGFRSVFTTTLPDDVTEDTGVAVAATVSTGGAGDEDYIAAGSFRTQTTAGAGTVGTAAGIFTDINHQSGSSIEQAIGLHVGSLTNAGTVNNTFGIKIEYLTHGTQPPGSVFAIDSQDPNARTRLAGDVGVGTVPTAGRLHVETVPMSLEPAVYAHVDAQTIENGGHDVVSAVRGVAEAQDMSPSDFDEDVVAGGHFSARNLGAIDGHTLAGVVANVENQPGMMMKRAIGVLVEDVANSGTFDNTTGIYIGNLTDGIQNNLPYSFFSEDPNARLYNAGSVGIGVEEPTAKLDVLGTAKVSDDLAVGVSDLFVDVSANRVGINDATPSYTLDVGGIIRATSQLRSTVAEGTPPLFVSSTTKVANLNVDELDGYSTGNASGNIPISNGLLNVNLNADMLDDMDSTDFATTGHGHDHGTFAGLADDDHPQYFNLSQSETIGFTPAFTAATPFTVTSTTPIANLNADWLDSWNSSAFFILSQDEIVTGRPSFNGGDATYAPFSVDSDIQVVGLNVDLLDGLDSTDFAATSHGHSGGDIKSGTVADAYVASTLTRDSEVFGIVLANDGPGSGLNADLLDNYSTGNASGTIPVSNGVLSSNLNADMVDGKHSSAFMSASADNWVNTTGDTMTGILRINNDLIVDSSLLFVDASANRIGILDTTPSYTLDVNGTIRATSYLRSTVATGTPPLYVSSSTKVTSLNADYVDGYSAGNLNGNVALSNGSVCANLSADMLDGLHYSSFLRSDTNDNFTAGTLTMNSGTTLAVKGSHTMSGTSPFLVIDGTNYAGLTLDRGTSTANGYILYKTAGANTFSAGLVGDSNYSICSGFSTERLTITSAGNVAINDSTPATNAQFSVVSTAESYGVNVTNSYASTSYGVYSTANGSSGTHYGVYGRAYGTSGSCYGVYGYANGTGSNRALQGYATGGSFNYGVYGSGTTYDFYAGGSGTNYAPFTGSHEARLASGFPAELRRGLLVSVTGEVLTRMDEEGEVSISSTLPTVRLACSPNDPAVFGVVVAGTGLDDDHWYEAKEGERFATVNALGEGRLWVSDINGRVKPGDYITNSSIPGYAQRQDDDVLHSYTVGKVTEEVDWESSAVETVEHDGKTYKVYLIAVVYTSG
jgi:hypothetical protein